MRIKKIFVQTLLLICSLFLLTSCIQLVPPVNNGGTNNEYTEKYPYELSLDVCSYDFYQLTDELFEMPISSYDITIDNPMMAAVSNSGYITTYMEGNVNIYFNKIVT